MHADLTRANSQIPIHNNFIGQEGHDNDLGADLGCCLVAWGAGGLCTGGIALPLPQPVSRLVNQAHLQTQAVLAPLAVFALNYT